MRLSKPVIGLLVPSQDRAELTTVLIKEKKYQVWILVPCPRLQVVVLLPP
jgi:hypothetical protein